MIICENVLIKCHLGRIENIDNIDQIEYSSVYG